MAASRHSRPSYVRIESEAHKVWREGAIKFHQNMLESFCSGPSKTGYHVVSNGEKLKEKIKIAIFGCDSNGELTKEEEKLITDLVEKIEKLSPEVYRKYNMSVLAIVYVQVLLNNDNLNKINDVLFRVPKLVEKYKDEKKWEKVNFKFETVEIEYHSGKKTVYDLKNCDSAYFIDTYLRVYTSCEDYKKKNCFPKGRMCLPQDLVYKAGEDGKVLVETLDTPACDEGALKLLDASTSVIGKIGAGIALASFVTPITAVVCWGAVGCATVSSLYSCGRSAGKLVDRAIYDQELSLSNKDARNLWIDTVFSGAAAVAGCKVLANGFVVMRANDFKMSSSEVAAVWSRSKLIMTATSFAGVLQVILTRVINNIVLKDWSDLPSIKNVFCLFLNIFSPVDQIKQTLSDIVTITKPILNVASSVGDYLCWSFDKLTTAIGTTAKDLLDIVLIHGKFLFKVSVGLFQKRFSGMHDIIRGLLSGDITLVDFAFKMIQHVDDNWSWFTESFHNAKQEYRKLCNEKKARNIIRTVDMDNEENQRKMFFELKNVIKVCEVDNRDNKQMESLIKLVDLFGSRLGANTTVNEFLYSVRVVCGFVKKLFKEKMNRYEEDLHFEKSMSDDDDFDKDKFNERFGVGKNVEPKMHFFTQVVALLQTEDELSKMLETYEKRMAAGNANKAIPSIQTEGIKQYLFINPSEVTDVSQDSMWQQLFRTQTGIAIDGENVHMYQEDVGSKKMISIWPKINNLNFVLAYFFIKEETPKLKGILSVCTAVKEE